MERSSKGIGFGPPVLVGRFDLAGAQWDATAVWMASAIHGPKLTPSAQCFVVGHPKGSPVPQLDEAVVCSAGGWPLRLASGWQAVDHEACAQAVAKSLRLAIEQARLDARAIASSEAAQLAATARAGGKARPKAL